MATARKRPKQRKKYFTVEEANATLPLLRAILRDITALAHDLRDRHQRLTRLQSAGSMEKSHEEEIQGLVADFERDQERMREYEDELKKLNVELKDYYTGLIDFPCLQDGREVYLCWKLDESAVGHWHEIDSGFSGRKKLQQPVLN